MTRKFRPVARGLLTLLAATSLTLTSWAHGPRLSTSADLKVTEKRGRDLAPATAESVGMSTERLRRLDAAMKHLVDDKQVAGLVTLVMRHGKIVDFNAVGQLDVRKSDPLQKDSIFRIYSMSKPITGLAMMMLYEEGVCHLLRQVDRAATGRLAQGSRRVRVRLV